MMSVRQTDGEGEALFEEMGGSCEDIASSEKLVKQANEDYKVLLETQRGAVLGKIGKLKAMTEGTEDWFDETGTLSVENLLKSTMRELEKRLLEIDMQLEKMAESQQEVLGETPESKEDEVRLSVENDRESIERNERLLMMGEERSTKNQEELELEWAKEWDKRRSERVYSSVDGEEFGREGSFESIASDTWRRTSESLTTTLPQESTLTEDWEEYVGGAPPPELLKQERLENVHMRIGKQRFERDREKESKEESAMVENVGHT